MTENGKQKILIVDDTPANLMILGEDLQKAYEVFVATDGQTALAKVAAEPPDLILLDIMMPGMDGYEVCRQLQADPLTAAIPVIFITAKNSEDDETRGLEAGAVDYITKPFRLPIVRARVRTHLELKRKNDLLAALSSRDCLTGVCNRRRFDEVLELEWRRARRNARPLALIMIDIDHFKLYNDNYGHPSGDQCLKQVALTLSTSLQRASDFIARYGGEEFVIILPETAPELARQTGERLRSAIEGLGIEHDYSPAASLVTVSAGVACVVPKTGCDHQFLLEAADNALYEAKRLGRNQVRLCQV